MANDTRVKTVLEFETDNRDLKQISKDLERTFDPRIIESFERGLRRATKQMEKLSKLKVDGLSGGGGSGGGGGGPGVSGKSPDSQLAKEMKELRRAMSGAVAAGTFMGNAASNFVGRVGGIGTGAVTGSATSSAMRGIPWVGGLLAGAADKAKELYHEYAQQQMAQATVFGQTQLTRQQFGVQNLLGAHYGIQPGEMPGLLGQFSASSGMQGDRLAQSMGVQLQMSRLLGINNAGSMIGAAETAGGSVEDPSQLMLDAVSSGIGAGIRMTRIDRYLQQVSSFAEEARSRGININPDSTLEMFSGFTSSGASFTGEAGSRAAGGLVQALQGAGRSKGMAHGLALRAAGFGQEGVTYQQALERLENPDLQTMARLVSSVQGMASNSGSGAHIMRMMADELGWDLSAIQSRELFENGLSGMSITGNMSQEEIDSRWGNRRGQGRASGVFGAGTHMAGMALRRQGIGAGMGGTVGMLERLDLDVMSTGMDMLRPVFQYLAENLRDIFETLTSDLIPAILQQVQRGAANITHEAQEIMDDPLGYVDRGISDIVEHFQSEGDGRAFVKPPGVTLQPTPSGGEGASEPTSAIGGDLRDAARRLREAAGILESQVLNDMTAAV